MNFLRASLIFVCGFLLACSAPEQQQTSNENQVSADSVIVGAEVLLQDHLDKLKGKRVGLVMNPTARVEGTHMLDTLIARDVNVTALFAPEHGFRGEAGAGETIEDGTDQATGLPVYSLYGEIKKPTATMLEKVDVLLFDMQDVGARFYTYNVTLGRVLEAAADAEVPVWVLDRPNPAGGDYVAGWVLEEEYKSFVGSYPIPMAHGMTLGELAKMMVGERWLATTSQPQMRIIPIKGWNRSMKWPATGLEWHPPSPNLPTFEHAYFYLGTVLFEGTNLSEGRGTSNPFLTIGSPQTQLVDSQTSALHQQYPSVRLKPITFTPRSIPGKSLHPKFEGEVCYGVNMSAISYDDFNPVKFGVHLLDVMLSSTENGKMTDFIYKLAGSGKVESLEANWGEDVAEFKNARQPYLIYE